MQQVISEDILNQRIWFYFYWLVWPTKYLLFYFNETALYVYLRLYVYILYNICPPFMSIWAPFVLYVCDFPPKDHPYTSIEDCMAIRALRVCSKVTVCTIIHICISYDNAHEGFFSSGAASCKSQQEKNNSTRKNNSIGKHIFRYKMCFLIELFFSFWLLHEAALGYCKWRGYHFYQRKSHYNLSTCPKRTRYRFLKNLWKLPKKCKFNLNKTPD